MNFIDNKRKQAADLVLQIADVHKFDFVRKIAELVRIEPFDFTENYLADLLPMFLRQYMEALDNAELIYFGEQKSMSLGDKLQSIDDDLERRMNSKLDEFRQQAIGITKYRWQTQGDDKVRGSHEARDGVIFSWDNPPAGGHPGSDFGCRCVAEPIIEEGFQIANSEEIVVDFGYDFVPTSKPKIDGKITGYINKIQPKTGEKINQVNIFVGGRDDDEPKNMAVAASASLRKDTYGENYYFHENQVQEISDLIKTLPNDIAINLIGHSYGADTAAKLVVELPRRVSKLVTIDPVSHFRPNFESVNQGVTHWINVNASGNPDPERDVVSNGNLAAQIGGKWGDIIEPYADMYFDAPNNHVEFNDMMNYHPEGESSAQQILNRGR